MATLFSLKNAEQVRLSQTAQMQRNVKRFYEQLAKETKKQIAIRGGEDIEKAQLVLLERDLKQRIKEINEDIQNGIVDSMKTTANAVVEDTKSFLRRVGFKKTDVMNAFLYVPDNVVQNIVNGNVYQDGWSLSKAIWGQTQNFNQKLSEIVAQGTATSKSAYEIAKDLEKYVSPTESKASRVIESWVNRKDSKGNWILEKDKNGNPILDAKGNPIKKRYKKDFYFGEVDYNAQRLARTMVSHAYQQSFEAVNRNDPFVIGYKWLTSNFHGRVCSICSDRATKDNFGLGSGVFPKDQLPLDHPNGMCTFEAVMSGSLTDISNQIADWYKAPTGTYPEIDRYAQEFLY